MKRMVGVVFTAIMISVFGAKQGYSVESCLKCHGTKEKLSGLIKKSPVKSGDELVTFLRTKSPKKALHNAVTDDQIRQAFAELGKK